VIKNKSHKNRIYGGAGLVMLLAVCWVAVVMVQPQATKAFTLIEFQAFTFSPIEVSPTQTVEVCATNFGDGSFTAAVGLLNPSDTTKANSKVQSVELKAHTSTCVLLPAVQTSVNGGINFILPYIALHDPPLKSGRPNNLTVSLQVIEGGSTKFVVQPNFLPAVQVPFS